MTAQDTLPLCRAALLPDATEEHPWLIDSLWARGGVGIIGGAPKCCKSWLALDMAVSVASATPCLDTFHVEKPGGVLAYMAEDDVTTIKTRLLGLCRHRALVLDNLAIDVITAPSLRLDEERDRRALSATVRSCAPALLLLDPFVRLHRSDENDAGDVSQILGHLRHIQREHNVAVIVVHHARKNGHAGGAAGNALRGSSDFHAWGDSNLYLRRQKDALTLTSEHRAARPPPPITLALIHDENNNDAHLEAITATPADPASTQLDVDRIVLEAIRASAQPISRPALRAALRIRNERLGDALTRLHAANLVTRTADRWAAANIVPDSRP